MTKENNKNELLARGGIIGGRGCLQEVESNEVAQ